MDDEEKITLELTKADWKLLRGALHTEKVQATSSETRFSLGKWYDQEGANKLVSDIERVKYIIDCAVNHVPPRYLELVFGKENDNES
jgi:hypothetical protein